MPLDEALKLLTRRLLIAARLLVEDYQVCCQPVHSPIGMGLEHLTDQADIPRLANGDQGNRQVARNSIRPQAGLALVVLFDAFNGRAQERVGKEQVAGELLEATSIVGLDAKQSQLKLRGG